MDDFSRPGKIFISEGKGAKFDLTGKEGLHRV